MRDEVREGYEDSDWVEGGGSDRELRPYESELLTALLERLPAEPALLDLGCGTGVPYDRWFVEQGADVTGIDIVADNIESAREHVPEGSFEVGDFSGLEYEDVFDAVVSFYAVFHIPREEHAGLFDRMHTWLRQGGYLLVTLNPEPMERYRDEEFLGSEMVWSSHGSERAKELLREAGFSIVRTYEERREDAEEYHDWVLARAE